MFMISNDKGLDDKNMIYTSSEECFVNRAVVKAIFGRYSKLHRPEPHDGKVSV